MRGLVIRPEQMKALQPLADGAFIARLVKYLRDNKGGTIIRLPEGEVTVKQVSDTQLHKMVSNGVSRAQGYGMRWETSLSAFVGLMFAIAPNFDEHPLIRRVLLNMSVPADSRLDELWKQTTNANWIAVKENYDPHAWY